MNRFEIHDVVIGTDHPCFPGELHYKIYNKKLKHYRFGCATTQEAAEWMMAQLLGGILTRKFGKL